MKKPVMRQCVACRAEKPKSELIRVVRFGETVLPDLTGQAPGRGAYVCREGACLPQALAEGRLARSLKIKIPPQTEKLLMDYWQQIHEADWQTRLYHLIGLGRRGRLLALGTQAVEIAVRKRQAQFVLLAEDAAAQSAQSLEKLCEHYQVACYRFGDKAKLGEITGKPERVTLAVLDEALAQGMLDLLKPACK